MFVSHRLPRLKIRKECDAGSFTLSNGLGSFLFLSDPVVSKYNGLVANFGLDMFKLIEDIRIKDAEYTRLIHNIKTVTRETKGNADSFIFPEGINGMTYQTSKKSTIHIDLDIKRVYDPRQYGRYHNIRIKDDDIIIKFSKMTDKEEDSTHLSHEYDVYLAIHPLKCSLDKDYNFIDVWERHDYPYDRLRDDQPFSRYVYRPFEIRCKGLLISFGQTELEALDNLSRLKNYRPSKKTYKTAKAKSKEVRAAFIQAQNSLDNLTVMHEDMVRIFAGYPWFFQFWTRDESISTIGLIKTGRLKEAKDILMHYLKGLGPDGRIPNRVPSSELGSADGVGWVFKRISDLIKESEKNDSFHTLFTKRDIDLVIEQLKRSISHIEKLYRKDGLIYNNPMETWMDTHWQHQDTREGFCVEIQFQFLSMLRLAHELTQDPVYEKKEKEMKTLVWNTFLNDGMLGDRKDDMTVRPNIFIAHYTYPEALSKKEWETVFTKSLQKLQLEWGGLSSIDKDHHLFTDHHTGSDNQSYHRGDSWFWINNLAAICLLRNNPFRFEKDIKAIIDSSVEEMLWHGSLGDIAEISDAKELSSRGCWSQAWSAALFIELIMEAYR